MQLLSWLGNLKIQAYQILISSLLKYAVLEPSKFKFIVENVSIPFEVHRWLTKQVWLTRKYFY